jgi:ABC-2 type transport system ATP-binding protein
MTIDMRADRPVLEAVGIRKRYGRKRALDRVSLRVAAGEAVAVVGENGSGKTTLMRVCAGALRQDAGSVTVAGSVGYSPQDPALLDLLSADDHLILFGAALGLATREALAQDRELLADLRFPVGDPTRAGELSGGSRQKLNLALALLGDPPILLLDEPYQGFDQGSYVSFWEHAQTWRQAGKAIVIITHVLPDPTLVDSVVELTVAAGGERR